MSHRNPIINNFRKHPRVHAPTPFVCSLSRLEARRWFRRSSGGFGVVYDVSLRGVKVITEAPIQPGDQVSLSLRLPKQIMTTYIPVATVQWTRDQTFGLAFKALSRAAQGRLRKYMTIALKSSTELDWFSLQSL